MTLLDQVRWFPGARALVSPFRDEIEAPGPLCGRNLGPKWTVDGFSALLSGLYKHSWVAPVAIVDLHGLGADDTPDRALLDYLEGGLPPLWTSRRHGLRSMLIAGTVTGPGGTVLAVVENDGRVRFQVIERLVYALRELFLIGPAR
ncbi:DUF6885 family protein [Amycolatopsis taiwanensis]|uniref:DUF6885 family protein n=1 Tax=Amycolatopsis taiwanensis TaxID=342230 RepID=UPI00047FAE1F|nr:hypothetical protein [Amycolatopsis taiwanensis]